MSFSGDGIYARSRFLSFVPVLDGYIYMCGRGHEERFRANVVRRRWMDVATMVDTGV